MARSGAQWWFWCLCLAALTAIGCSSPPKDDGETTGAVSSALSATLLSIDVTVTSATTTAPLGVTVPFKATGMYDDLKARSVDNAVTWTSSAPEVGTVDVAGVVTTRTAGSTTITARHTATGLTGTLGLTVSSATLTSIGLAPVAKNLGVGLTQKYTATGVFSDATKVVLKGAVVTWTSNAPGVATINASGVATAIAPGVAVITVTHALTGVHESVTLLVGPVTLASIAVSPPSPNIPVLATRQLTAIGTYSDGSTVDLTSIAAWKSSKATVATISTDGLALGVAGGAATMTATFNGNSGTALLTVGPITLTSLAITPSTLSLPLGFSSTLVATGTFLDKTTHDVTSQVTWSTTNTKFVTVSNAVGERGKLTTVAVGTGHVKATDPTTGVTTTVPVIVTGAALTSLTINPPQVAVPPGLTVQCNASGHYADGTVFDLTTAVTWSIIDAAGVTISNAPGSSGLLTAAPAASAPGFVKAIDAASGINVQVPITISAAVQTGLELTPPTASILARFSQTFVATAVFSDGTRMPRPDVFWTSSNMSVLFIDPSGRATGSTVGSSVVSATDNGFTATANVTVRAPAVVSLQIVPSGGGGVTPKGLTNAFRVFVRMDDPVRSTFTSEDITWSTSNPAFATISNVPGSKGILTAVDVGSFVITAVHPASGFSTTLSWRVSAAELVSSEMIPEFLTVPAGRTATFTAIGHYTDGTTVDITHLGVWLSGDTGIATVTTDGVGPQTVFGKAVGLTSIFTDFVGGGVEVTPAVLDALAVTGGAELQVGEVSSFAADGTFSDGTHVPLTAQLLWSSSNAAIASVSNAVGHEGEVTAIGAGTATITARDGATGLTASKPIAVTAVLPMVAAGQYHTCVLLPGGKVRCWGFNDYGQVGDAMRFRGSLPGEMGGAMPEVSLGTGRSARAIAAGSSHTCALLDDGRVKCWGANFVGQLGSGDNLERGKDAATMGDALPAVQLGAGLTAKQITAGQNHTCALLSNDSVKCWGFSQYGALGLGDTAARGGPGSMGDALPTVALGAGRTAKSISAGGLHTCALLDDDSIKCWGLNQYGNLGLGDVRSRGVLPGEMGDALPAVALGAGRTARSVVSLGYSTCALLDDGHVKCWGYNSNGQLGQGDTLNRGGLAGQMGDALTAVDLGQGRMATRLGGGAFHACASLDDGRLKCWGWADGGQLGLGSQLSRGILPGQMGDALPVVDLGVGRSAKSVAGGGAHTCAVLDDASLKCWGYGGTGQLGLGDDRSRGINPGEMGDALPAVDLSPPFDLSIDSNNCGTLAHSCLGGVCTLGVCQPIVLASNQLRPAKLRLVGGMLTWNTHGDGFNNGGGVYRASVNGGEVTSVATGLSTTSSIAVDGSSTAWTDSTGIHIGANGGGVSITLAPTASDVTQIAMDATDLYFTTFRGHQVIRVSRDGASGLVVVADLEDSPFGIALDNANVYFTNRFSGAVKSLSKAGGASTELATGGGASHVVLGNGHAYWVGEGGLKRVPVAGGATEILANDPTIQLSAIGIDGDSVFFPTYENGLGTIQAVPLNGGVPRVLASGQSLICEGLQSDGAALYYTDAYGGRVMKVAK